MNKEEYLKEFKEYFDKSRSSIVGYILKRDGYIDGRNDYNIRILDKCFDKIKITPTN